MDEKSAKPKRVGNHYIPPPARKQGIDMNEATRHKERPMKTCENRGVKLCNDSSLLFKEGSDKVKEKSGRSRRSKRTTKKADAENASLHGENEVVESKSSFTAPGLTDRINNFQSGTGSDVSVFPVEKPIIKGLENMKKRHPVELSTMDGYGEEDNLLSSLKPLSPSDQDITVVSEEVENQLQSLKIIAPNVCDTTHLPKYESEVLKPLCTSDHDTSNVPEKVENQLSSLKPFHSSNQKVVDSLGEESQSTTLINDPASEYNSQDPRFSSIGDYSMNICDGDWTSSKESVYIDCDGDDFAIKNNSSSGITTKIKCLTQSDFDVSSDLTEWNESNNISQIYSIEDGDWDSIYDDQGDCLLPSSGGSAESKLVEVSKNNMEVQSSDPKKVDDDDRPQETSSIIEIYGFSEDLKTRDILTAFGNWVQRGFNLKWVDNTHALGVFPSPTLAEEALCSNIPLVKIRPISQGTALSQEKARTLVLPSSLRPKTCTALARRLVSGALGLKVNVTPEERAAERELLREAREKKKLVSKQRDAAWEGIFPSLENWYVKLASSNKSNEIGRLEYEAVASLQNGSDKKKTYLQTKVSLDLFKIESSKIPYRLLMSEKARLANLTGEEKNS